MHEHAIGIVAHHTREHMAKQLADHVDPLLVSIDNGELGANQNHRRVWQDLYRHNPTPWSVILEDDSQPINDFNQQLDLALRSAPHPIVSLYLGRNRPPQYQQRITDALNKADINDAHWITGNELLHAVAVAIHTHLILDMLVNMPDYLPIDQAIGKWARKHNHTICYSVPSLLDHNDTTPTLINPHHDGQPRTPGRTAWRVGSHDVWNSRTVEL